MGVKYFFRSKMTEHETFFTVVGCMDGRVQEPVLEFGREKFNAQYPDTITEPGIVGTLSNGHTKEFDEELKGKLQISLERHGSRGIIVDGHSECAGNPVEDDLHRENIIHSAGVIRELVDGQVDVVPVFVNRDGNGGWIVEEL